MNRSEPFLLCVYVFVVAIRHAQEDIAIRTSEVRATSMLSIGQLCAALLAVPMLAMLKAMQVGTTLQV